MSLAWNHKRKIERQLSKEKTAVAQEKAEEQKITTLAQDQNAYNLQFSSLETDLKRVSMLPRGTARVELKKSELLPKYMPYVTKYIEAGDNYSNAILVQVMIWLFDVGNIPEALKLADLSIAQKQSMPERFTRSVHTFTADAFLDYCIERKIRGESLDPNFAQMYEKVLAWPVHDVIKMKYMKIKGAELEKAKDYKGALKEYVGAQALCAEEAKVTTVIAKLKKLIEKVSPPPAE